MRLLRVKKVEAVTSTSDLLHIGELLVDRECQSREPIHVGQARAK